MISAYNSLYLNTARETLGGMLDYAAHSLHYQPGAFFELFIASGAAENFGRGDIRYIAGMSGAELALEVLRLSGIEQERVRPGFRTGTSREYWSGSIIAYYQWKSDIPFDRIAAAVSLQELCSLYDERRSALLKELPWNISEDDRRRELAGLEARLDGEAEELLDARTHGIEAAAAGARLAGFRKRSGLSQSGLAAAAGIPVRTVQQYEQGQKDLGKARAEYLICLAKVLNCDPEDLISK